MIEKSHRRNGLQFYGKNLIEGKTIQNPRVIQQQSIVCDTQ